MTRQADTVLAMLRDRAGQVVPTADLVAALYGADMVGDRNAERVVATLVHRLRKAGTPIRTASGYRLGELPEGERRSRLAELRRAAAALQQAVEALEAGRP